MKNQWAMAINKGSELHVQKQTQRFYFSMCWYTSSSVTIRPKNTSACMPPQYHSWTAVPV